MCPHCLPLKQRGMLRLRILPSGSGRGAIGRGALGEEAAQPLLKRRSRPRILCGGEGSCGEDDKHGRKAAEQGRATAEPARSLADSTPASGRELICDTAQRQTGVPKSPLPCCATKVHAEDRAGEGALCAAKRKTALIWDNTRVSVF